MTLTRPPTPPKVLVSHALVILALGATLSLPLMTVMLIGLAAGPWSATDVILYALVVGMCVGAALCWRWPRTGTLLFMTLWVAAFMVCRGEPEASAECLHQLITTVIGGAFLLLNLFVTEVWVRRS